MMLTAVRFTRGPGVKMGLADGAVFGLAFGGKVKTLAGGLFGFLFRHSGVDST